MIQKSRFTPRQRQALIELGQRTSGGGFNQLALSELFAAGMVDVRPADHRIVLTNRGKRAYRELIGETSAAESVRHLVTARPG